MEGTTTDLHKHGGQIRSFLILKADKRVSPTLYLAPPPLATQGNMRGSSRQQMVEWVLEACKKLPAGIMKNRSTYVPYQPV